MDARDLALEGEEWLAHARVLRRLAAALVRDAHEAEDLVQETWLRAEGAGMRSRPWLRTVLRNLVRDRARSARRRAGTERAAAREERVPSSAEVAAELETAQRLVREVAALDEPQRLAIHLRYFEGLTPLEIAERCGLPPETVRTRLKRGLAELRARMDRAQGGDRRAWAVALAPLVRGALETSSAGMGLAAATAGGMMAGKLVLATAAAVLAVFGGWFYWTRRAEPGRYAIDTFGNAYVPEPTTQRFEPLEGMRAAIPPGKAEPVLPQETPARVVPGSVVIVDEHGVERTEESGVLGIASGTKEADAVYREVPFESGRFRTEVRDGEWIAFAKLVARGREAALPERVPIRPGSEPLVVRGRWLARGRIRVIDALSRRELLDGIEVRCGQGWRANPEWSHPGDDERVATVVADGASPIELPERTWLTPYWVHAPGHAWTRVDFDHRAGGERTVELSPAASSVIVTTSGPVPEGARVRLYADRDATARTTGLGTPILRRPALEGLRSWQASVSVRVGPEMRIDDFQPGRYLATVEVGEYEDLVRLGAAEVEVPEGGTALVTIPVDAARLDVPRTRLAGTVRVPPGLDREECSLRLKRLERGEKEFVQRLAEMSHPEGEPDVLGWDAGWLRTGTYLATLTGIQHRVVIEAQGGETRIEIVVPPLVTVTVEVVEEGTGIALEPERLQWCDGDLPGVRENARSEMRRDLAAGTFEFVAPRGTVEVHASVPGYRATSRELELTGTTASCRIELARATAIRVLLREGDAALPVGFEYWSRLALRGDGGERIDAHSRSSESETTLLLDRAGRCTLELPPLEGFEPIESRTVDVLPGETVEVLVVVRRKP